MLLKRQSQVRFSIESAIIDPWQTCQGSKKSSEWSISIIVHSIHLGSQLRLEMVTLGNCLLRNVRSLILRCLDLKGVKQQICCWLKPSFCLLLPQPDHIWLVEKSSTCGVFLKFGNIFLCKHHCLLWNKWFWLTIFMPRQSFSYCHFARNYIIIQKRTSFLLDIAQHIRKDNSWLSWFMRAVELCSSPPTYSFRSWRDFACFAERIGLKPPMHGIIEGASDLDIWYSNFCFSIFLIW